MSRVVELLCSRRLPHVAALALMSIGFAGCSADMQSRFAQDGADPGQPSHFGWHRETTGSVPAPQPQPQVERRELPQYSRPQPQVSLRPCRRRSRTAVLSDRQPRRVRRRAGIASMRRRPSAARGHRDRCTALGCSQTRAGPCRHHDHRRYQRHAGNAVAPLQCFVRRDPAGQRLQGTPRVVAGPATDHSAPDRGGCRARSGGARSDRAGEQGRCRAGRAHRSRRQSWRYAAQHRPSQSGAGGSSRQGQRSRCPAKLKLGQKVTVPARGPRRQPHRRSRPLLPSCRPPPDRRRPRPKWLP